MLLNMRKPSTKPCRFRHPPNGLYATTCMHPSIYTHTATIATAAATATAAADVSQQVIKSNGMSIFITNSVCINATMHPPMNIDISLINATLCDTAKRAKTNSSEY